VSGEEIRLPPQPQGSRGSSANFKPVFGSLQLGSDAGEESVELKRNAPAANGGYSAPLSRQTSRQSRPPSPRSRTQLPSPASQTVPLEGQYMRFGSGPYSHRPSNTAPLPQHPFTGGGSAGLPRPPGRGNGRTSFSHPRGAARGGFRGGHMTNKANMGPGPNGAGAPWSPTGGVAALPDTPFANGNQYQRGYGMGYQGMFSAAGPPQNFGQMMDPMQGYMGLGMYGRGVMPPAPMPQTSAPNLDPLRFYVLGQVSSVSYVVKGRKLMSRQVEYYFSMQNLAMDFFLRQQVSLDCSGADVMAQAYAAVDGL
jgi:la-related protein 1